MKNFIMLSAAGMIGYLIGYYEMKCKTLSILLAQAMVEKQNEEDESK